MTKLASTVLLQRHMAKCEELKGEPTSASFDLTTPSESTDYGESLAALSIAVRTLHTSVPNGQIERTQAAYQLLMRSTMLLESYFVEKNIV